MKVALKYWYRDQKEGMIVRSVDALILGQTINRKGKPCLTVSQSPSWRVSSIDVKDIISCQPR